MSSSQFIGSAPLLLLAVLFVLTDCVAGQQTKIASTSSADIEGLVDQLRLYPWEGPRNFTSPIHWVFNFTDPMCKILETESAAQEIPLRHLNDEGTKNQIIVLLGGVGDAKSIEPIIHAMADEEEQREDPAAKKMSLVANIALTNITAAEVIWHRGGGISPSQNARTIQKLVGPLGGIRIKTTSKKRWMQAVTTPTIRTTESTD